MAIFILNWAILKKRQLAIMDISHKPIDYMMTLRFFKSIKEGKFGLKEDESTFAIYALHHQWEDPNTSIKRNQKSLKE